MAVNNVMNFSSVTSKEVLLVEMSSASLIWSIWLHRITRYKNIKVKLRETHIYTERPKSGRHRAGGRTEPPSGAPADHRYWIHGVIKLVWMCQSVHTEFYRLNNTTTTVIIAT